MEHSFLNREKMMWKPTTFSYQKGGKKAKVFLSRRRLQKSYEKEEREGEEER